MIAGFGGSFTRSLRGIFVLKGRNAPQAARFDRRRAKRWARVFIRLHPPGRHAHFPPGPVVVVHHPHPASGAAGCRYRRPQPAKAKASAASAAQAPRQRRVKRRSLARSSSRVLDMAIALALLFCLFIGAILGIAVEENNAVSVRQSGPTSCHIPLRTPASNQNEYGTLTIAKLWRKACAKCGRSRNLVALHLSG